MKIAALTMAYRDYWALEQWMLHYGRLFGRSNLYVISHGDDPRHDEICRGASIIKLPRERIDSFDTVRHRLLNSMQNWLQNSYDWVLRGDCDELVLADPEYHEDLSLALSTVSGDTMFALGFDLFEAPGATPVIAGSVFGQRHDAVATGDYSKCVAFRNRAAFRLHGYAPKGGVKSAPFEMPEGVYLIHLKHANVRALQEADGARASVASDTKVRAWQDAAARSAERMAAFAALPDEPWDDVVSQARERALSSVQRLPKRRIVRVRKESYDLRGRLPDRFVPTPEPD